MKTRILHTKIWNDTWFRSLTTEEGLFFFYLLTNECCNVLEIYELPQSISTFQIGIDEKKQVEMKEKFKQAGKIDFYKDYIHITNAYKYQFYKGAKNNSAKLRLIYEMSDGVILHFDTPIGIAVSQIYNECVENSVTDQKILNLLQRVINRLLTLNITLSIYPYPDTRQKLRNQKSEIRNQKEVMVSEVLGKNDTVPSFAEQYKKTLASKTI